MSWPIPEIPAKVIVPQPEYVRWVVILLAMTLAGALLAIFPGQATGYDWVFLHGMLPAILLWLCLFGLALHRYEQSVNAALLWHKETERTRQQWQRWSRKQQIVLGYVTLTPEENGVDALTGNPADIPAYPAKARPLFADLSGLNNRLEFINKDLERQCPGYRHHLSNIVVQYQKKQPKEEISLAVYHQWQLYPQYESAPESFCAGDKHKLPGLQLLICLQDWADGQPEKYSEFITAQLITTNYFASQNSLAVLAGVGRSLSSESLTGALDMLVDYNRLEKESMRYVWFSGLDADDRTRLVQHITAKQWPLPARKPLISLDHSFGLPGPLMFPVAISLLVAAAQHTGEMQLLISRNEQNMYSLCLITRELFL